MPPTAELFHARYGLRASRPATKDGSGSRTTTEDAKALRALTGGATKSFDQLPLPLQQHIEQMRKRRG